MPSQPSITLPSADSPLFSSPPLVLPPVAFQASSSFPSFSPSASGSSPMDISVSPHKRRKRLSVSVGSRTVTVSPSRSSLHDLTRTMDAATRIDLSDIPRDYLEHYPYPAFALVVPIPPSPYALDVADDLEPPSADLLAFTRAKHAAFAPFDILWANDKWRNLTHDKSLLDCLSVEGARSMGDWLSGARSLRASGHGPSTGSARTGPALPGPSLSSGFPVSPTADDPAIASDAGQSLPPQGFWEAEMSPYEDRSVNSDGMAVSDADSIGIEGKDGEHPGPATLTLALVSPGKVTLELTKTVTPAWRMTASGSRSRMSTHTLVIITTTPRSAFIPSDNEGGRDRDHSSSRERQGSAMQVDSDRPSLRPDPTASKVDSAETVNQTSGSIGPPKSTILPASGRSSHQIAPPLLSAGTAGSSTHGASPSVITPTKELEKLDLLSSGGNMNRPIMFNRDGSVSRPSDLFAGTWASASNKSLDVRVLLDTTDWEKTALGPRENWPQSLRSIVSLVMGYPHQCCLWWGKELTLIYNESYAQTIPKHPDLFGMSGPVAWAEIWSSLGPLSELVLSGTPVWKEDDFLLFKQLPYQGNGTFEYYHTWMWVPVLQEDGTFGGLWNATIETTKKVLAERRLASVREMGERTSIARTMEEFDSAIIDILTSNPKDVPFAALYHVEAAPKSKNTSDTKSESITTAVRLAGAVGIPEDHPSIPSSFSVTLQDRRRSTTTPFSGRNTLPNSPTSTYSSLHGMAPSPFPASTSEDGMCHWPIEEALRTRRLVLVEDCASLIEGYSVRVWDELPTAAVVVPIANDSDEGIPSAVLVLGLNIRRPFDDDYESFIHVLRLQLASGITAVGSYEAERQRIEDLAALDRAKSMLFSNVSHELRTPLTLVAGPLEDLLLETPDGPKKEMLITARRNVRRLTRLVSTLMDVSRLEAGKLKGSFRPVNLGVMTRDLAGLFGTAIRRARLKYVVDCDVSSKDVYVDPEHWEKIIFNLIGNAMKYTLKGYVKVHLTYVNNEAVLRVEDSGVGIPSSDINLVGDRFHRVQSVSRSHEGTGIGLSLIKELIKLHGGVLEIDSVTATESSDGSHGSTFRVRIPLGSDHLPLDAIELNAPYDATQTTYGQGIVDEAMQWTEDKETSSGSGSGSGSGISSSGSVGQTTSSGESASVSASSSSRGLDPSTLYFQKSDVVMLVDDSTDVRRYMRSIFASYCTVIEARDGQEALELCKKNRPDLIISDVMMPRLDGFGLLSALKNVKELALIPVIMLTARGGEEAKIDGLLAGADDYVAKPFNSREIIARGHMQLQLGKKRRHLEKAFDERTVELRAISEYSPVGIFRCDEDREVIFANGAWYEMSGFPPDQPVTNWEKYITESQLEAVLKYWNNVFELDEVMSSIDLQYVNGRWVNVKIIRLDLIASGMTGALGCATDITERKNNEESQRQRVIEAEQRRVEAEDAKRQQELLIDITSHEIRNPISSLMQISLSTLTNLLSLQEQLEMVLDSRGSFVPTKQLMNNIEEDLEALESIYQCGLAQERISNDVLSLGKIQLDMLQMFDVEVEMRRELQKVLGIFQNEARMKRIALALDVGANAQKLAMNMVKTDPVRLNQVVTNLISNAIRFTAASDVRRIVLSYDASLLPPEGNSCLMPSSSGQMLESELKDDMPVYLYFAVTDTGPGMTPKELEMLFQRFSQVSPKTHTIFGGSGLGLFVCRKITELMGGRIEVVSEKGKGSTFRFFIRGHTCQTAQSPMDPNPNQSLSAKASKRKKRSQPKTPTMGGKRPHVLIVEDNLINQTVLARQLKHCNLTCDVASNGQEALDKIRAVSSLDKPPEGQAFDCVLMDLEMPIMDGLTAVRHIREDEAAGKLSLSLVIALTGNARQGQIDEAKASGMDEVVIKPYRLDDLLQKIEEMMKIRAKQASEAADAVGQVAEEISMSISMSQEQDGKEGVRHGEADPSVTL